MALEETLHPASPCRRLERSVGLRRWRVKKKRTTIDRGSELERAQIDGLVEHTQDLKEKYKTAKKEADGNGLSEFYSGVFREFAERIEARVASMSSDAPPPPVA